MAVGQPCFRRAYCGRMINKFRHAADGGAKPNQEALRFASTALHSLPTVEVRTGRFSEGIFEKSEDVYLNGSTASGECLAHKSHARKNPPRTEKPA
jgi:hypothetical protein